MHGLGLFIRYASISNVKGYQAIFYQKEKQQDGQK